MKLSVFGLIPALAVTLIGFQNCAESDFQAVDEATNQSLITKTTEPIVVSPVEPDCKFPVPTGPKPKPTPVPSPNPGPKYACPSDQRPIRLVYDSSKGRYINAFRDNNVVPLSFDLFLDRPTYFQDYDGANHGWLQILVTRPIKEIANGADYGIAGNNPNSYVEQIRRISHLGLWGPLGVGFAEGSHVTIYSDVIVKKIHASHIYIKKADAKNLLNTEICASWLHILE